ncbi:hypothetical protein BJ742DRAFT_456263 [Cladochytrium replicatum]|nr:hypothetical protein BJ742DRAFT_456263 [Cladochytrium replicatum]
MDAEAFWLHSFGTEEEVRWDAFASKLRRPLANSDISTLQSLLRVRKPAHTVQKSIFLLAAQYSSSIDLLLLPITATDSNSTSGNLRRTPQFHELPDVVLRQIFVNLAGLPHPLRADLRPLVRASGVCKAWCDLARDEKLWSLICVHSFPWFFYEVPTETCSTDAPQLRDLERWKRVRERDDEERKPPFEIVKVEKAEFWAREDKEEWDKLARFEERSCADHGWGAREKRQRWDGRAEGPLGHPAAAFGTHLYREAFVKVFLGKYSSYVQVLSLPSYDLACTYAIATFHRETKSLCLHTGVNTTIGYMMHNWPGRENDWRDARLAHFGLQPHLVGTRALLLHPQKVMSSDVRIALESKTGMWTFGSALDMDPQVEIMNMSREFPFEEIDVDEEEEDGGNTAFDQYAVSSQHVDAMIPICPDDDEEFESWQVRVRTEWKRVVMHRWRVRRIPIDMVRRPPWQPHGAVFLDWEGDDTVDDKVFEIGEEVEIAWGTASLPLWWRGYVQKYVNLEKYADDTDGVEHPYPTVEKKLEAIRSAAQKVKDKIRGTPIVKAVVKGGQNMDVEEERELPVESSVEPGIVIAFPHYPRQSSWYSITASLRHDEGFLRGEGGRETYVGRVRRVRCPGVDRRRWRMLFKRNHGWGQLPEGPIVTETFDLCESSV